MKKKKVALLQGGMSSERDVSLVTGKAFAGALQELGYEYIVIDAQADLPARLMSEKPDVALLALHGKYAEDGVVQGICEYLKIPYSGTGVLGSALCMDKILSKQVLRAAGLPTAESEAIDAKNTDLKNFRTRVAFPLVVKPSRDGSSMGISICRSQEEIAPAIELAARFDHEILLESYLEGPEVTVPILDEKALTPIEISPKKGFYDYTNKYTSGNTEYLLPPRLPESAVREIQALALKAHQVLRARIYSRVDFRLHQGKPFILEVNTLPGCTPTSLLPKSAKHDGISFARVIETLVEKAGLDYEGLR
jgi:D-alanine-D-alanine ligase